MGALFLGFWQWNYLMGRIKKVWIDQEVCLDHETCLTECREVFEIRTDECVASVRPNADRYFVSLDEEIRSAVACCPMEAIHIEEEADG